MGNFMNFMMFTGYNFSGRPELQLLLYKICTQFMTYCKPGQQEAKGILLAFRKKKTLCVSHRA